MAQSLENRLVVAISSRALFDLEESHRIFTEQGLEAYSRYQMEHEDVLLEKGVA
jgi:5'-nucleotidase